MTIERVAERVTRRLASLTPTGESHAYATRMWQSTLATALGGGDASPEIDALRFPYLPIDPERFGLTLTDASAVLDVGCLAGHGLFDLYARRLREGRPIPRLVGIDIDGPSIALARTLAPLWSGGGSVHFVKASCETIPFAAAAFDLVVARVVLPYVDLERSMRRLAAVLRPGGLALIQVHAPGYYLHQLVAHLRRPVLAGYYGRALLSGLAFTLWGRQLRSRWFRETPLQLPQLASLAARHRLWPCWSRRHFSRPLMLFVRR